MKERLSIPRLTNHGFMRDYCKGHKKVLSIVKSEILEKEAPEVTYFRIECVKCELFTYGTFSNEDLLIISPTKTKFSYLDILLKDNPDYKKEYEQMDEAAKALIKMRFNLRKD